KEGQDREYKVGGSLGFGYNATRGLEGVTLEGSFSSRWQNKRTGTMRSAGIGRSGYISFAGESYIPGIEVPMKYNNYSFTLRGGGYIVLPSFASGIAGFYSKQQVDPAARRKDYPAFGLMNAYKGRTVKNALMDYYKENDKPYTRSAPYLP